MESNEKIIIKRNKNQGVDKSIIDFNHVSSVPVVITKVVKAMHKKGIKTFIGIKDGLLPGEIIQTGNLGLKYKITEPIIRVLPEGGYLYRVKRVDGANITNLDITAISVGDKVKIKNRRSFKQMFAQAVAIIES